MPDITLIKVPELSYPWTGENLQLIRFPDAAPLRIKPLDRYFKLIGFLMWAANKADEPRDRSVYSQLWSLARDARIFEIPSELYMALYKQAERHTCRMICGEPELPNKSSREDIQEYSDKLASISMGMNLPEQLPFQVFYFGYTVPMVVPRALELVYNLDTAARKPYTRDNDEPALLCGHLFIPGGEVWSLFVSIRLKELEHQGSYSVGPQLMNHRWYHPVSMQPWVLPALIEWINEHKTVVEEVRGRFSHKRATEKFARQISVKKLAPPPYYAVYLKNLLVEETARIAMASAVRKHIDWQHRWTVRGHFMVRVKRGALPLDSKLETELRKRKYRIFTLERLDAETSAMLQARGVKNKALTEWMAVLVSWRKDHVKGPEDKPLIPSIRKVKEGTACPSSKTADPS
jgi:hypothetical protein